LVGSHSLTSSTRGRSLQIKREAFAPIAEGLHLFGKATCVRYEWLRAPDLNYPSLREICGDRCCAVLHG
jgi:hypothetical protein